MHFALNKRIELEPYLKVSGVHEFLTGDRVTLNETGFNPTLSGTLLDAAVGLTAKVSQSVYLYGEDDYANGDRIRQPWAVNAGVRWQWGVSQKRRWWLNNHRRSNRLARKKRQRWSNNHQSKRLNPGKSRSGFPAGCRGQRPHRISRRQPLRQRRHSDKFSSILTILFVQRRSSKRALWCPGGFYPFCRSSRYS